MSRQNSAYIHAIAAVLLWSTAATAFKLSLQYLDFIQLLLIAAISSVIVLFMILVIQGKLHLLKTCTKSDLLRSALYGFINPFLYYMVLFSAYSLLSAQEAVTLNYTWPIMLALLSIPLLGQKIGWKSITAIFVSFLGVFIIATQGNILGFRFTNLPGALLALGSAVIWALSWIFNIRDNRDEVLRLFLNFVFGFVYILIALLIWSDFRITDWRGIVGGTYVGLFEMGITFVLWLKALNMSKTTARVSNLIYASPFLSLVLIHFVVGEDIHTSTIFGLACIIAGILMQRYFSRRLSK